MSSQIFGDAEQIFDGEELRRRRVALDMSPTQLGARIDRCADTVSFYELGFRTPPLRVLCAISDELGCQPTDLLVSAKKRAAKKRATKKRATC